MMLETLNSIDWSRIHHSHGTAEKFPLWLDSLAQSAWVLEFDDSRDAFYESAISQIAEYSNHQGSIYEVTPVVVPFLIELLQNMPHRAAALLLVLSGYAHDFAWDLEDLGDVSYVPNQWSIRVGRNLRQHLALFTPYLDSPDRSTRLNAARLLNVFQKDSQVADLFARRLQIEDDPLVRAKLTEDDLPDYDLDAENPE
jgi:hypothetical protein